VEGARHVRVQRGTTTLILDFLIASLIVAGVSFSLAVLLDSKEFLWLFKQIFRRFKTKNIVDSVVNNHQNVNIIKLTRAKMLNEKKKYLPPDSLKSHMSALKLSLQEVQSKTAELNFEHCKYLGTEPKDEILKHLKNNTYKFQFDHIEWLYDPVSQKFESCYMLINDTEHYPMSRKQRKRIMKISDETYTLWKLANG